MAMTTTKTELAAVSLPPFSPGQLMSLGNLQMATKTQAGSIDNIEEVGQHQQ